MELAEEKAPPVADDGSVPASTTSAERDEEKTEALEATTPFSPGVTSEKADAAIEAAQAEHPGPEPSVKKKGKVALTLLAICLAVFLAALDVTIVTTALPSIIADFNASESDFAWVGSAYMLAAAGT
jgi:hypothetical protein